MGASQICYNRRSPSKTYSAKSERLLGVLSTVHKRNRSLKPYLSRITLVVLTPRAVSFDRASVCGLKVSRTAEKRLNNLGSND